MRGNAASPALWFSSGECFLKCSWPLSAHLSTWGKCRLREEPLVCLVGSALRLWVNLHVGQELPLQLQGCPPSSTLLRLKEWENLPSSGAQLAGPLPLKKLRPPCQPLSIVIVIFWSPSATFPLNWFRLQLGREVLFIRLHQRLQYELSQTECKHV